MGASPARALPPVPTYIGLARPQPLPLAQMRRAASEIVGELADVVERIEVAGSIRRSAEVAKGAGEGAPHRIVELVALPTVGRQPDLFGEGIGEPFDLLERRLGALEQAGTIQKRRRGPNSTTHWGPLSKAIVWYVGGSVGWVAVDLFVPRSPDCWGGTLAIRTGPAAFSKQLVVPHGRSFTWKGETSPRYGLMPRDCEWKDGWLWRYEGQHRRPVPLREEADLFRQFRLPFVAPEDRR